EEKPWHSTHSKSQSNSAPPCKIPSSASDSAIRISQTRPGAPALACRRSSARRRTGKDRLNCYRMAAGSADELHTALRVAIASRYLEPATLAHAFALLD